ncbi:MAG TPA: chemotaxis response regulator protein-glutamate methylesterase, partial [Chryseosolibacter sp.]
PDVITLDIEMPRMDGLTFLKKIMTQAPMPVIVISNQTVEGADVAMKALEAGAVDIMAKPNLSDENNINESRIRLADKIRSAYHSKNPSTKVVTPSASPKVVEHTPSQRENISFPSNALIAIGASTGGTEAIRTFLESLPDRMPPILIVQHMPEKFTAGFAKRLDQLCKLTVKEAVNNEPALPNTVYIAPGNYHMAVQNQQGRSIIKVFSGDLVNRHRPSVNVLFQSVAETKGKHAIGIIMTGMGDDGATGMLAMSQQGAFTVAQDEASCVVFGMPQKAILLNGVSRVVPLSEISKEVCERLHSTV